MAIQKKGQASGGKSSKSKKQKQPTQRPPMQRIAVMNGSGKIHFEWRPW